ncbi:OLC1v1007081C3 [Oldenlandia corymbosa var. corymbosa]|uniref:OLC1v1007081C3 n=1 Tax=Oldenlandia corymbosa var. corymbosa TaxID=529605 RepID=A0AAV1DL88_OLDCO|nr:OLC1v1007081C3 [Oldenlandia corymbosa var. corymbosa]
MEGQLHRALRCLCSNTGWKYAVFWRLKHRARMMLTWEDGYYYNGENQETKCPSGSASNLQVGQCSRDPLGIALAKMSYHVYCLGEGVVGRVAVTGHHIWIATDKLAVGLGAEFENDGWQAQFSAGIRTIAVVPIVPHGVVQLGSLDNIAEDFELLNHIKDIFCKLLNSWAGEPSYLKPSFMGNSSQSDVTSVTWGSAFQHDCLQHLDRNINVDEKSSWSSSYSSTMKSGHSFCNVSLPQSYENKRVDTVVKHEELQNSESHTGTSVNMPMPISESGSMEKLNHEELRTSGDTKFDGQNSGSGALSRSSGNRIESSTNNLCRKNNLGDGAPFSVNSDVEMSHHIPGTSSAAFNVEGGTLSVPKLPSKHLHEDLSDTMHMPLRFCAGYELLEALGPAFQRQDSHCEWDAEKNETMMAVDVSEGVGNSSLLTVNTGSEYLLDAVIANVPRSDGNKSEKPFCKSELPSDPEKVAEPSSSDMGSITSAGYSFDRGALSSFSSSVASGLNYSKGLSSTSSSRGSETLGRPQEPNKMQKKRAKPGESCRPRPRDRQLIQDRIKELRELVPNGSKCSIDSLLERTIKHMVFMQSITKHVEKLSKCPGSKFMDQEVGLRGSPCPEPGSSWAVEVGSDLKVCPIIVENLNMNGQLLVEMLCDECSHFLEVAEAIRGMGLAVLKGVTETYGEKTWMRFVVEGQTNGNVHRMDILWSLVQLLQPKLKT